ncbi:MAG: gluconate 2-dehydrogenase subunit 3 family protein [Acidobacteriia bacterium]|nr:gluconate 2-dehydrogenase subunit 3 family protein [Terriglobia bacterium]
MVTRRQWLLQLGGGVVLAGWSGVDLDAAELPPGLYEASRDHLGHALAGGPVGVGGETELVQLRAATFQPAFFSPDEYQTIRCLTALMLGETSETAVVREIAEWIDLTLFDAADVRTAARALSPAHRAVAVAYYGAEHVRKREDFDAQKVTREGLAWIEAHSRRWHGGGFISRSESRQIAILQFISDERQDRGTENAGTRFFSYFKERVVDGFYTSRAGLDELGYRGNAFYASPPGCEHLYG